MEDDGPGIPDQNMIMFLNPSIKLTKVEIKQNQALALVYPSHQILLDLTVVILN